MKLKKVFALLLAAVMTLSLLAACGGGGDANNANNANNNNGAGNADNSQNEGSSQSTDDGSGFPTITWYQVGNGMPANIDSWTNNVVNPYLEEKLGIHLNIQCVGWGDWGNRRNVMVQTNEPYDIMFTDSSTYTSDVAMGAFADLTDLIQETPGLIDVIPADYLTACEINGKLYGIPAYKDSSMTNFFVWTKQYVDAYYPDYADIHSLADATPALEAMRNGTSEPPMLLNKDGVSCVVGNRYDNMGSGLPTLGVSYYDGTNKVVSTFEQKDVMDQLKVLYQWMMNGMINSDAAVAAEATGMCGVGIAQGWPAAAKGWGDSRGAECVVSQLGDSVLSNDTVRGSIACISNSSSHQLEALKLLELVNTDTKLRDMLAYGEEGVNFEYVDITVVVDGEERVEQRVRKINNDWALAAYTQGTYMNMTVTDDNEINPYTTQVTEQNNNAIRSPALGFYFDTTAVADEIAACKAIFEEYKGGLQTGTLEPEATVAEMMAAMRDSGFDDIVAEAQKQLDLFLAG